MLLFVRLFVCVFVHFVYDGSAPFIAKTSKSYASSRLICIYVLTVGIIFSVITFLYLIYPNFVMSSEVHVETDVEFLEKHSVFSVQSLLSTIAVPESLDLGGALDMINSPWSIPDNSNELFGAVITTNQGAVPLLHHLFSLYQRLENNIGARDAVTSIFVRLLFLGADPNSVHPMTREPSLLFKTIFLREVVLANALLEVGAKQQTRDPLPVMNLMLNIPCDLVPTTKLLLHADEMLKMPRFNNSFQGGEGRRRFVASASRQPGSKPIPRSDDLYQMSKAFKELIPELGFIDSLRGLDLGPVVASMGDTVTALLESYLANLNSQEDRAKLIDDLKANVLRGRNVMHTAAAAGHGLVFNTFEKYIEKLEKQNSATELKLAMFEALSKVDERGQTPVDMARLRWGFRSVKQLKELMDGRGTSDDVEVSDSPLVIAIIRLMEKVKPPSFKEEKTVTESLFPSRIYGSIEPSTKIENDMKFANGGWDGSKWSSHKEATQEGERCDALEIDAEFAKTSEFSEWFFQNHLITGTPLVIRQGVAHTSRRNLEKSNFQKRYGSHQVPVGVIPYGHSFGVASQLKTLGDIANANISGEESSVNYAFTTPEDGPNGWASKLAKDVPMPTWLTKILAWFGESGVETQFYLGPKGSGAPVHFHGHAVNFLSHGLKEWVISPPISTTYSKAKATTRYLAEHNTEFTGYNAEYGNDDDHTFRCTQHAGDVFYVPTLWGHGTFNHAQSIGVAFEISLESFCME